MAAAAAAKVVTDQRGLVLTLAQRPGHFQTIVTCQSYCRTLGEPVTCKHLMMDLLQGAY